jgi:hypothetical protein
MAGDPSRPPWRDAALVALLAVVLVAGLVYYGVRLSQEAGSDPAAVPTPSVAPETIEPSPGLSPAASPTEAPPLHPGTCWDDAPTPDVGQCALPTGVAGLEWVFPEFDPQRSQCRENPNTDRSFGVELSWVCTERALGREVLISYDQVSDIDEVDAFMHASVPAGQVVEIPGANGGRCVATDTAKRPARITGWYERFPYVVSVFAPTRASAERAWKALVVQRPAQAVRGQRA